MSRTTTAILLAALPIWLTATAAEKKPTPSPYQLQLPAQADYKLDSRRLMPFRPPGSITEENKALDNKPYASRIDKESRENGLDPALVHAVIEIESRYRADAISPKGAVGLMQVLPSTAQRFGIHDPASPEANLKAGTRYLRTLLDHFEDHLELAIAAYNAGEGAVERHGNKVPPYAETRAYVPAVMERYKELSGTGTRHTEASYLPGTRLDQKAINRP